MYYKDKYKNELKDYTKDFLDTVSDEKFADLLESLNI